VALGKQLAMRKLMPLALCLLAAPVWAQPARPTLYVVGYAHLDTQWRWEYPEVISDYLRHTLRDNFALFEKYPHYLFNFSGANRYRLMKEYFPADYARMQQYVAAGRWFPAGSSMEECDLNSPSAESVFRQVLYGNEFFRRDFHKDSAEFLDPDCFGFPSSLPSILAHAGLKGFSTQKLVWGSSAPVGAGVSPENTPEGIPFNVGSWLGPDGRGVIAALNPGAYNSPVRTDLSSDPAWVKRLELDRKATGLAVDFHYYGTGDIGGAPDEASVKRLEQTVVADSGPIKVIPATTQQMFLDLAGAKLPTYTGELELTNHSAGSLTSQCYHREWNRRNEVAAGAAESAALAAELQGLKYPLQRLSDAWALVLSGQFHDSLAGTATQRSYTFTWNDDLIALNQFEDVLRCSVTAVAAALDTRVQGRPVVVYNSLNIDRDDLVETPASGPARVFAPGGREVPAQFSNGKLQFVARVPSLGFAVYDVRPGSAPRSALKVSRTGLENERYRVALNAAGDVSSVFDKLLNRELLAEPIRLAFQTEKPFDWPAWNMDWEDQQKAPRGFVSGPARIRVVENGPARVALQVERETEGSRFVQTVRLTAGGQRVEFANSIDWRTRAAALKATFKFTAHNPEATYNWDVGTIGRGNNEPRRFEVPTHQWFDLTDRDGAFGATVLTDCKYGSDKPDDQTMRLTLIYTPGLGKGNSQARYNTDQETLDFGHHDFVYGLAGHADDWRAGNTDWDAYRLNQPLQAFAVTAHPGPLGQSYSILKLSDPRVRVLALKKAETGDEWIVRVVETSGWHVPDLRLTFHGSVLAARETDAQERTIGPATLSGGQLVTSLSPNQPRTFAVRLAVPTAVSASHPVALSGDLTVVSHDGQPSRGGFDAAGDSFPAEQLPKRLESGGVEFQLAPKAVTARGQTLQLPPGHRVYLLAAGDGDQRARFRVGSASTELSIQDWTGFIGQWDNRELINVPTHYVGYAHPEPKVEFTGKIAPAYCKSAPLAWFCSHHHNAKGENVPYAYSYLFRYELANPTGARTLTLPNNSHIKVLAVTTR
jgi:alpha-mannosidase